MLTISEYFFAGFQTTWSGRYFNGVELLRHYKNFDHPTLKPKIAAEYQSVSNHKAHVQAEVNQVQSLAQKAGIVMMPVPDFPEAYFSWSRMCYSGFGDRLRESTPPGIAFRIGYHSGGILASMRLLSVILNVSAAVVGTPAFELQWKNAAAQIRQHQQMLQPAANMANMVPRAPDNLRIQLAEPLIETAGEIAGAETDFSNDAYLLLLSSKVRHIVRDFTTLIEKLEMEV